MAFAIVLIGFILPTITSAADSPAAAEAEVVLYNRTIAVLRSPQFGLSPADRASRAMENLEQALDLEGPGAVTTEVTQIGTLIRVDGRFAFIVQPGDADLAQGETPQSAADDTVKRLKDAIAASREADSVKKLARAIGWTLFATFVALALMWIVRRLRMIAARHLPAIAGSGTRRLLQVRGTTLLHPESVLDLLRRALKGFELLLAALIIYQWLGFVLGRFAYTRPWGDQLTEFLLDAFGGVAGAVVAALPDLFVAGLIFLLANLTARTLGTFLQRAAQANDSLSWLDSDTVGPTRRIASIVIWLFALAMAYPYLPGSDTEAFKGLSVLVGLMISLGGSSVVGQASSGLVLMYTRTLRAGDYVEIAGYEGTIVGLGTFTTRLRTGRGEELSLPNSLVMGSVTRNYSRTVYGRGFVLDTEVTIGYDTPWRQIEQMLVEAAHRTPGILLDPPPKVFQLQLADFYPRYRLVCQAEPSEPRPRAVMLSMLHANIQDVFNENEVQIMSPHYLGDPQQAKWVPPAGWNPGIAPAIKTPPEVGKTES